MRPALESVMHTTRFATLLLAGLVTLGAARTAPALTPAPDLPTKAVRFMMADVDEDMIERTIPIGRMVVNNSGTTARFSDPKGLVASGITALLVKRRAATGEFELQVKGKGMDLSSLDKNHIQVAFETDTAAFVKTRTFQQSSAKRTALKVVEK